MKRDLAIRALKMAVALRQPPKGCSHHTDRGSQYCSHDYQKLLRHHGFMVSMSGKGNCYDNSAVETFFKTIKADLAETMAYAKRSRAGHLPIHQRLLQSAKAALSTGLEKPGRFRKESRVRST